MRRRTLLALADEVIEWATPRVVTGARLFALSLSYQHNRPVGGDREPRDGLVDPTSLLGRLDATAVADD
jgi:hypothetical protein